MLPLCYLTTKTAVANGCAAYGILPPATMEELRKIFGMMSENKAPGLGDILNKVLQLSVKSRLVRSTFKTCLKEGLFLAK